MCACVCAGNSNNLFSIDNRTGLVTRGLKALDRETSSSHVLEVEAFNSDEGSMRSSVRVRRIGTINLPACDVTSKPLL